MAKKIPKNPKTSVKKSSKITKKERPSMKQFNEQVMKRLKAVDLNKIKEAKKKTRKAVEKFYPSTITKDKRKSIRYLPYDDHKNILPIQKENISYRFKTLLKNKWFEKISIPIDKKYLDLISDKEENEDGKTKGIMNFEDMATIMQNNSNITSGIVNKKLKVRKLNKNNDEFFNKIFEKELKPPNERTKKEPLKKREVKASGALEKKESEKNPSESNPTRGGSSVHASTVDLSSLDKKGINNFMLNKINELLTSDDEVKNRITEAELNQELNDLELKGGPADTTAYHDFYKLEVAFDHVWTELFDTIIVEAFKHTYGLLAEIDSNSELLTKYATISDYEEFTRFYEETLEEISYSDWFWTTFSYVKLHFPEITLIDWIALDYDDRTQMYDDINYWYQMDGYVSSDVGLVFQPWEQFQEYFRSRYLKDFAKKYSRIQKFLRDIDKRMKDPYIFKVFKPGTINYGLLLNYRQKWEPKNYQVGELVSTMPLAPKEIRKYSKKIVIKKKRIEKELENSVRHRKEESKETGRVDKEIVDKAMSKKNFSTTGEAGFDNKIWHIGGGHAAGVDSGNESQNMKKEIREQIKNAINEYKSERKTELSLEGEESFEETTSGEITNPNNELTVTYLFYELQRQYEISEKLHRVTPVIFVANEIPAPHEVDEEWLLAHDWIIKRVILDDSFLPALKYISNSFVADEAEVANYYKNWDIQQNVVEAIKSNLEIKENLIKAARTNLQTATEALAKYYDEESQQGYIAKGAELLLGSYADPAEVLGFGDIGGGSEVSEESVKMAVESAREMLIMYQRETAQLKSQLGLEMTVLTEATTKYNEAFRNQLNRRIQIDRLKIHVKENIYYYMQTIWAHENPDQRFLRLCDLDVFKISSAPLPVSIEEFRDLFTELTLNLYEYPEVVRYDLPPPAQLIWNNAKLSEIADLSNLLGYFGNYMVFPLKHNNIVTMHLISPYIDKEFGGLSDPDPLSHASVDDILDFAREVIFRRMGLSRSRLNSMTEEERNAAIDISYLSAEEIKAIKDRIQAALLSNYKDKELTVVPTDSLFIEALPGKYPLLEDFKLKHRALDVKNAEVEVNKKEIENLRLVARLLSGHYDDEVEKKIILKSNGRNTGLNINTD